MKTDTIDNITLINGDCLKVLPTLPDKSVDLVLTDLPYGCLNKGNKHAQWDKEINLDALWAELFRVAKPNAAIVLFGQGLFSARLMMSQPKLYRYSLVWDKINRPTGFLDAKRKPLKIHEDILVFYRSLPTYNPQMSIGNKVHSRGKAGNGAGGGRNRCYGAFKQTEAVITNEKYPLDAYSAWMEWQSERTPKRWRAEKGKEYFYFDDGGETYSATEEHSVADELRYSFLNYFKDEHTVKQAAEAVRECLAKFHEKNQK